MADVLFVYREVALLRESGNADPHVAIISYDEKPGIQAMGRGAGPAAAAWIAPGVCTRPRV